MSKIIRANFRRSAEAEDPTVPAEGDASVVMLRDTGQIQARLQSLVQGERNVEKVVKLALHEDSNPISAYSRIFSFILETTDKPERCDLEFLFEVIQALGLVGDDVCYQFALTVAGTLHFDFALDVFETYFKNCSQHSINPNDIINFYSPLAQLAIDTENLSLVDRIEGNLCDNPFVGAGLIRSEIQSFRMEALSASRT